MTDENTCIVDGKHYHAIGEASCYGCAFVDKPTCPHPFNCTPELRADNRSIVWILDDDQPTPDAAAIAAATDAACVAASDPLVILAALLGLPARVSTIEATLARLSEADDARR